MALVVCTTKYFFASFVLRQNWILDQNSQIWITNEAMLDLQKCEFMDHSLMSHVDEYVVFIIKLFENISWSFVQILFLLRHLSYLSYLSLLCIFNYWWNNDHLCQVPVNP